MFGFFLLVVYKGSVINSTSQHSYTFLTRITTLAHKTSTKVCIGEEIPGNSNLFPVSITDCVTVFLSPKCCYNYVYVLTNKYLSFPANDAISL